MSKFLFFNAHGKDLNLVLQKQIDALSPMHINSFSGQKNQKAFFLIYTKDPYLLSLSKPIRATKQSNPCSKFILLIDSARRPLFHFYLNHDVDYPIHIFQKEHTFLNEIQRVISQNKDLLPQIILDNLQINPNIKQVSISNKAVKLRPKEYDLFEYLLINKGKTIDKTDILEKVWEYNPTAFTRTVDTHFHNLNKNLNQKSNLLHSINGKGYLLENLTPL